jgi:hypothetical protein
MANDRITQLSNLLAMWGQRNSRTTQAAILQALWNVRNARETQVVQLLALWNARNARQTQVCILLAESLTPAPFAACPPTLLPAGPVPTPPPVPLYVPPPPPPPLSARFAPTGIFLVAENDIPVPAIFLRDNSGQAWSITTDDQGNLIPNKILKQNIQPIYLNDSIFNTTSWMLTIDTSGNLHSAQVAYKAKYSCAIFIISSDKTHTTVLRITPSGILLPAANPGTVQCEFFGYSNPMLMDTVAYTWMPDLTRQWCAIRVANRASLQLAAWPTYNFDVIGPPPLPPIKGMIVRRLQEQPELRIYFPGY